MPAPTPASRACAAPTYIVGVDGGGSGTRSRLQDGASRTLGQGQAGPSGLGQGIAQAWRHIDEAVDAAFAAAALERPARHTVALGLGLAGASVAPLRAAFLAANPGYAVCALDSDAVTLLIGAHAAGSGVVVAAGTGSVAAVQDASGARRVVGGWGFPVGDEGSGAWLGLRAMQATQAAFDGRAATGALTESIRRRCGEDTVALQAWCSGAGQHAYAQLAPLVFSAAEAGDRVADALLQAAADELARLASVLQPADASPLPVVVGGSVGQRLAGRWPEAMRRLVVPAAGDSADGALRIARAALTRGEITA